MFWFYEKDWVDGSLRNESYEKEVAEYRAAGLEEFCASDGIPLSLKAHLFSRYAKWSFGGFRDGAEAFKAFYLECYGG